MTRDEKIKAIKEALWNSDQNGNDPGMQPVETLAVDLWMDATCELIEYEERLEILKELDGDDGWLEQLANGMLTGL